MVDAQLGGGLPGELMAGGAGEQCGAGAVCQDEVVGVVGAAQSQQRGGDSVVAPTPAAPVGAGEDVDTDAADGQTVVIDAGQHRCERGGGGAGALGVLPGDQPGVEGERGRWAQHRHDQPVAGAKPRGGGRQVTYRCRVGGIDDEHDGIHRCGWGIRRRRERPGRAGAGGGGGHRVLPAAAATVAGAAVVTATSRTPGTVRVSAVATRRSEASVKTPVMVTVPSRAVARQRRAPA